MSSAKLKEQLAKKAEERGYSKTRTRRFIYGTLAKVRRNGGDKNGGPIRR